MAVKPITGVLASLPATAGGTAMRLRFLSSKTLLTPVLTIQGYHVPAVRHRDAFYQKLEDERASSLGQK
ncbi:hypothetical protein J4E85_010368 [Alternaria conjuncta]|uniref:uncharacterized protein n=1 Tax=Alternaria conjuncta TaxID=181017 RepID=UPI00221E46BF|nr:uncharacterized protein J4E85_010368 [Alternaria conjuncta]KAI4915244.1 hypothetical protein J4E85_010368 [Alternaria conjuncta]